MENISDKRAVKIMGVLNVTPDSFSDGGKFFDDGMLDVATALFGARKMIFDGADIIDIGGESTGPGSGDVPVEEELRRVLPVIEAVAALPEVASGKVVISVDTYKAEVARRAIHAGARMINDVTALRGDSEMASVVAHINANDAIKIVLMYSKDPTARTTREPKQYKDVAAEILEFLEERIAYARAAGIKQEQIIIDPGMGAFVSGDPKYSYEILKRLQEFKKFGLPILIGASRKSFLPGALSERLKPTLEAHALAVKNGADIIRVHDVAEHKQMLQSIML